MINILVDTNIFTREKLNFLYVDANQSSSTDIHIVSVVKCPRLWLIFFITDVIRDKSINY